MPASEGREALLWLAGRLSLELGYPAGEDSFDDPFSSSGTKQARVSNLDAEDELLVTTVRRGLTQLAHGLGAGDQSEPSQKLVAASIDGAEMTIRGELMSGRSEQLPALLPSFVFLVALPIVQQDEAFELSQRTVELIKGLRPEP